MTRKKVILLCANCEHIWNPEDIVKRAYIFLTKFLPHQVASVKLGREKDMKSKLQRTLPKVATQRILYMAAVQLA